MMGEPCYDTLRTKQQLGYSVHAGTRLTHGVLGFCIVVASGAHALPIFLNLLCLMRRVIKAVVDPMET